MLEYTLRLHST